MTNSRRPKSESPPDPPPIRDGMSSCARAHFRFGWWSLLIFLSLGIVLEAFHGLKIQWYLAVTHETRQLLWPLAHAHGTLLSLINIIFALGLRDLTGWRASTRNIASRCLYGATLLLPGGFFLGGSFIYAGDPGLGVLLVPLGALLLVVSVFLTARASTRSRQ